MVDLVTFLLRTVVSQPDAVTVESARGEGDTEIITATVAPADMGRAIGKNGKIISAIRELVKVKAIKSGTRVKLILKDPLGTDQSYQSEPSELPPQNS